MKSLRPLLTLLSGLALLLGMGQSAITTAQTATPEIILLQFPKEIKADGTPVMGLIGFKDTDADLVRADFSVVQATDFQAFSLELKVKGIAKGEFSFQIATKTAQRVVLRVVLVDEAGHKSAPWEFSFETVGAPGPQGMILVPAGSFRMGDNFSEGDSREQPVHAVYVSAFYMDKYEVTKALWDQVANWAAAHGYDIWPMSGLGKAADHPVNDITWYEAVKWANARSEKEGLMPSYYTSSQKSAATVYRTGQVNVQNDWVRWDTGYRLPTEAEWEKGAQGGVSEHRFPWNDTDTIQHTRANYYSDGRYSYDTSPTRGLNPTYATGSKPYTSPVGSFTPNGYGLYDMAGNVWEWAWDWYDSGYYSSSPGSDPYGPESGSLRVGRGGGWDSHAYYCRVAFRSYAPPGYVNINLGFRLVRTAP